MDKYGNSVVNIIAIGLECCMDKGYHHFVGGTRESHSLILDVQ